MQWRDVVAVMKLGAYEGGFERIGVLVIANVKWRMQKHLIEVKRSIWCRGRKLLNPKSLHEIGRLAQWQGA